MGIRLPNAGRLAEATIEAPLEQRWHRRCLLRRCVLLLAVLALVPAAGASAAYRAVIVGIDHYHHDWAAPLDSCVNDAKGFRAALLSDPVRWQPGNITLLLDEAATEDAIRDALAAMAAPPTASGDVCVYFHSSHGDQVSDTDTFVATYDAEFDDYELAVNLAAFPLDVSVINVIDACYAGGMFKDAGASRKWPFGRNVLDKLSVLRAASRVAKDIGDGNVAFVTACDYDETTASGSPYSQFSEQFIRGIGAAAADSNSDENWTFWEVFQYAKARADDAWQTAQYYEQSLLQGTVVAGGMGDFLTVVFPDGGETLRPGSSYWIAWVSNVGGTVALDLYDGGFWSATIASGTADTGGFEWAVPAGQAEGTGYTVLATAWSLSDESDAPFTVRPLLPDAYENDGSFAQAKPIAGGETQDHTIHVPGDEDYVVFVLAGASHVVIETAGASGDTILDLYDSSHIRITYNDDGGTGSFSRIETVLAAGTYYAIVFAYDVDAIIDAYALSLTVGAPLAPDAYEDDDTFAQAKSIAGGETQGRSIHVPGDVDYIRFTLAEDSDVVIETSGAAGDTVLELYDSSEGLVTSDDDGGVGLFSRIGRALTAGTYYAVVSSWDAEQTILAYALSLTTTPNTPSVEVVSPNGSESWQAGTSHVIQWNANQVGPYVRIELYVGGAPDSVIVSSTYDDGSFDWNIPQFQAARTDYRIRITSTYSAALWDESDAAFAITAAAPYIVVTSPNGGERWELGETESIVWRSNVGGYVRIELYSGGALDVEVAASTANDGRHSWIVPASHAEGNDYTLVVSSLDNPAVTDESDGTFSIVRYEPPTFNCSGAGVRRTGSVLAPALALALLAGLARLVRRRAGGRSGI